MKKNESTSIDSTPWNEEDLNLHALATLTPPTPTPPTKKDKVPLYTSTESRDQYLKQYGDTSKAIRALLSQGLKQGEVARLLNIRPQHVHNVKNQIIKSK